MKLRIAYRLVPVSQPIISLRGAVARPRPLIRCRLLSDQGQWAAYAAKLDTGADDTLFPWSLAQTLGLDLGSAPVGKAHGVGSVPFEVRYASVRVRIVDDFQVSAEWSATVAFTQQKIDYALLGYAGCLEFFTSTFDAQRNIATLDPNVNFHSIAQGSIWKSRP